MSFLGYIDGKVIFPKEALGPQSTHKVAVECVVDSKIIVWSSRTCS